MFKPPQAYRRKLQWLLMLPTRIFAMPPGIAKTAGKLDQVSSIYLLSQTGASYPDVVNLRRRCHCRCWADEGSDEDHFGCFDFSTTGNFDQAPPGKISTDFSRISMNLFHQTWMFAFLHSSRLSLRPRLSQCQDISRSTFPEHSHRARGKTNIAADLRRLTLPLTVSRCLVSSIIRLDV
jgi:hypothetical protein